MLAPHELERLRRSAAMGPLTSEGTWQLIDTCQQLLDERRAIAEVLAALPGNVKALRQALNELYGIVAGTAPSSHSG